MKCGSDKASNVVSASLRPRLSPEVMDLLTELRCRCFAHNLEYRYNASEFECLSYCFNPLVDQAKRSLRINVKMHRATRISWRVAQYVSRGSIVIAGCVATGNKLTRLDLDLLA